MNRGVIAGDADINHVSILSSLYETLLVMPKA